MALVEYSGFMELIFEVRDAEEGGFYARALGHAVFTEAENWEELRTNVLEAIALHFEGARERPRLVQLHYVRDELIPVEAA
jgi:predicted RNase H-like HicB family nuclease